MRRLCGPKLQWRIEFHPQSQMTFTCAQTVPTIFLFFFPMQIWTVSELPDLALCLFRNIAI